jgi:hypothetical protein
VAAFGRQLSVDLNEAIDQEQNAEKDNGAKKPEGKHGRVAAIRPSLVSVDSV